MRIRCWRSPRWRERRRRGREGLAAIHAAPADREVACRGPGLSGMRCLASARSAPLGPAVRDSADPHLQPGARVQSPCERNSLFRCLGRSAARMDRIVQRAILRREQGRHRAGGPVLSRQVQPWRCTAKARMRASVAEPAALAHARDQADLIGWKPRPESGARIRSDEQAGSRLPAVSPALLPAPAPFLEIETMGCR